VRQWRKYIYVTGAQEMPFSARQAGQIIAQYVPRDV